MGLGCLLDIIDLRRIAVYQDDPFGLLLRVTPKPFGKGGLNHRLHGLLQTGPQLLSHRLGSQLRGSWRQGSGGKLTRHPALPADMTVNIVTFRTICRSFAAW